MDYLSLPVTAPVGMEHTTHNVTAVTKLRVSPIIEAATF